MLIPELSSSCLLVVDGVNVKRRMFLLYRPCPLFIERRDARGDKASSGVSFSPRVLLLKLARPGVDHSSSFVDVVRAIAFCPREILLSVRGGRDSGNEY